MEGARSNTRRGYRGSISHFIHWLNTYDCPYDRIEYATIDRWILSLRQRLKPTSVNFHITAVRSWYRWLKRNGYVTENLFSEVRMLKRPKLLPKPVSEDRMQRILGAATAPQDKALVELLYSTGARIEEVARLDLGALDLDNATVLLMGKGEKERLLPLGRPAVEALRAWLDHRRVNMGESVNAQSHLWRGRRPQRPGQRTLRKWVRRIVLSAGITERIWPHRFRHSCATHLVDHGADLRMVQEFLGHASILSTQIYVQVSTERMRKVFDATHPRALRASRGKRI